MELSQRRNFNVLARVREMLAQYSHSELNTRYRHRARQMWS